jgi:cytochrome c oxidase cbb3-type subunit 3
MILIAPATFSSSSFSLGLRASTPPPDGAALFSAKCAKCHGADGRGTPKYLKKGQNDFTDVKWQKSRTDGQLTKAIADGKGDFMPSWKEKLSAEEIKALVGQVRAFGKESSKSSGTR